MFGVDTFKEIATAGAKNVGRDTVANLFPFMGNQSIESLRILWDKYAGRNLAKPVRQDSTHLSEQEYKEHKQLINRLASSTYNPLSKILEWVRVLFGGRSRKEKLAQALRDFGEASNLPYGATNYANDAVDYLTDLTNKLVHKYGVLKRTFSSASIRKDEYIQASAQALKTWMSKVNVNTAAGQKFLRSAKATLETMPEFLAGHDRRYADAPGAFAGQILARAPDLAMAA